MYHRYSSPRDLISMYVDEGRFGELVQQVYKADKQRKREETEREDERKLWALFVHSGSQKSYNEWKAEALRNGRQKHVSGDKDMNTTAQDAEAIISKLFPSTGSNGAQE